MPLFILAGIPQQLQNYDDPVSQAMALPSLLEDFARLDDAEQRTAVELLRRRRVHYHYVAETERRNSTHYAAFVDPVGMLRRRLFHHASNPWEGETLPLKVSLTHAVEKWEEISGGGTPCPIAFEPADVAATRLLEAEQAKADEQLEACRDVIGFRPEGWVPVDHYEEAMVRSQAPE